MQKINSVFIGAILLIIPSVMFAQNNTNSPHTRYGYGNLADKAFISQRGMGGIGYGLRNSQMINPMNPASFSNIDSLTFMFDMGVMGQITWFDDGVNKDRRINGNIEYLALQFPLSKKMGIGAGFEPVSYVGYYYGRSDTLSTHDGLMSLEINQGTGGLNRVYTALSYDFLDRLSIGVKVSYLFGDIFHTTARSFNSFNPSDMYPRNRQDTLRSTGFLYDFGLQYHQSIGKFKSLVIGAIYTPKTRFRAKVMQGDIMDNGSSTNYISRDSIFEMPETYGLGFTYNRLGKVTVGADVLYQKWAEAKFYNRTDTLNNRLKINMGGEWIPNYTSNNLLNRIHYRAGLYYTNSYLKVMGSRYNEYGATMGFGIPLQDRRSFLNLAFEYTLIRPKSKTFVNEQYFKVSLGYTFNELWFFKRKVQ